MYTIYIDISTLEILIVSADNENYDNIEHLVKHGWITEKGRKLYDYPVGIKVVKQTLLDNPNYAWDFQLAKLNEPI